MKICSNCARVWCDIPAEDSRRPAPTACAPKTTPTSSRACSTASRIPDRPSSTAPASPAIRRPFCPSTRFRSSTSAELHPPNIGWKPGAVVNVGLKSGTNSIHGTAFAFGRDGDMFDARNYFNTVPERQDSRTLEQYGGSVGGPIIKDKAFFFGAYEGQMLQRRQLVRRRHQSLDGVSMPTPATASFW